MKYMNESTLLKIAMIISSVGLVLLYLVSDEIEVSESSVEKINTGEVGEVVKVSGLIESVSVSDKVTFLSVKKTDDVKVIVFDKLDYLEEGMFIEVVGEIEEYEGEREVIGNAVRIIS